MRASAPYFGTQVVSDSRFVHEHPVFYVFGSLSFPAWVVPKLLADHTYLELLQGGPADEIGDYADICFRATVLPFHVTKLLRGRGAPGSELRNRRMKIHSCGGSVARLFLWMVAIQHTCHS